MNLPTLDWIIILAYLAASLIVGFYFSKRALRSVNDYFVSGRVLPWWLAGMSMIASAFARISRAVATSMVEQSMRMADLSALGMTLSA